MSININIKENSDVATVITTEKGASSSKTVALDDLLHLFTNLKGERKDTGYLSSNLLREEVNRFSKRAFYFKEVVSDFQSAINQRSYFKVKSDNPFGITIQDGYLTIPNFIFREIIGVINNSNTDAFNPSWYRVYCANLGLSGQINDNTKVYPFFPNQFSDGRICWPNEFDNSVLNDKDVKIQSTFVTRYLTSKFNSDLFSYQLSNDKLRPFLEEFTAFVESVFICTEMKVYNYIRENLSSNIISFLWYFFLSNIKGINPATLMTGGTTLGNFFRNDNNNNEGDDN